MKTSTVLRKYLETSGKVVIAPGAYDGLSARLIAEAGFEVVEAANADQAIEILEARRDITVVFTDIQMPGSMDGLKLALAVRGRWPPIKIVATSGHVGVRETDLPEGGRFLPKPYNSIQVTGMLRELTAGG